MKHNNQLPNGHFHKDWQTRVKTWFDQPGRKKRRRLARQQKAARIAPRPLDSLRPAVRCPSLRYNTKLRAGRGFTLEEIKLAGVNRRYARTIGIAVDHRRRNKSEESLALNVERLKAYLSRLVIFPKKAKIPTQQPFCAQMLAIVNEKVEEAPRVPTVAEKSANAVTTLHYARLDARYAGIREKRRKQKEEEEAAKIKK